MKAAERQKTLQSFILNPELQTNLYAALPYKKIWFRHQWQARVMFFSPENIYQQIKVKPFCRIQTHLAFKDLFPDKKNTICSCGCGELLTGRRRRWAHNDCVKFACAVWAIIDGQAGVFEYYVRRYYGKKCAACGVKQDLKVDHIVPVKYGGGGCWLTNFQLLCHSCHVIKTNKDFNREPKKLKTTFLD